MVSSDAPVEFEVVELVDVVDVVETTVVFAPLVLVLWLATGFVWRPDAFVTWLYIIKYPPAPASAKSAKIESTDNLCIKGDLDALASSAVFKLRIF